jgi:Protein of unknown function (DUF3500)
VAGDIGTPSAMRASAAALLKGLDDQQRHKASLAFADDAMRRWIEYRPQPRPGACLADLDLTSRKAAHRLLATALSPHAFAQATTIMALEEVLDASEGGRRGRHSADYWVAVFGDPDSDEQWGWRFEGHHLSVTMTVDGATVSPTPVFLGANPARTDFAGRAVVRPLAPEEDLARALLDALGPAGRDAAVVAPEPPADIHSGPRPQAQHIEPRGVASGRLSYGARALLDQLTAVYLERLPAELAAAEAARLAGAELHFAWEGAVARGAGHYYRIQGPDLLIEYDNTANGANHAHTVLRRPQSDFGGDVLAAHRSGVPHPEGG